jgi:hypothetical protein
MRTIVLVFGFLFIVPLRCTTADDIIPLEKSLTFQNVQSCQDPEQCTQRYTQCRGDCSDVPCTYNCCINFRGCMGAHFCNILYIQCYNY